MMKKIFSKKTVSLMSVILLMVSLAVPVFAKELPRVVDNADLIDDTQEQALTDTIAQIAEEYNFDVVIVTTNSLDGKTATEYADDYFDYTGYGYGENHDGILFAISMGERQWAISTTGYGITVFTDYSVDLIGEQMVGHLSSGDYYGAFEVYVDMVEQTLKQAKNGAPFDIDNRNEIYDETTKFHIDPSTAVVAVVIGFILSTLIAFAFKKQLKTAVAQDSAANYGKNQSLRFSRTDDVFLHTHTTRTKIESSSSSSGGGGSSTHTSSSGTTHGGSSGSF